MTWWMWLIAAPVSVALFLWGLSFFPSVRRAVAEVEREAERGE